MKRFAFVSCIGILAFASANAQEFSRFTADLGIGYTAPAGRTGQYVDWGWHVGAGAGVNFSPYLGTMLNVGTDSMGINSTTLGNIGISSGNVRVFHATVDPVVHLSPKGRVDFYLTGGGGLFHLFWDFSTPGTDAYIPLLGLNSARIGANQFLASSSVNKPGFDVGGGVNVKAFGRGKFFVEAKWDHMFLNGAHLDFVPVSFGYRW
jgi:hypothetical protein